MSIMERKERSTEVLRLRATVRGREVLLTWRDGRLTGDPEVVGRAGDVAALHSLDLRDPASVLRCIELALGSRPVIDLSGAPEA